ncbi:MAG: glycosyltransferase family 4 protein [Actinomycetota bacterium]|nr:glycosyltransferase family 4 protein [Actinomycetota bacterium]
MRVLIDTTFARRAPLSGTGIYVNRLLSELAELDGVEPIEVANIRRRPPAGGGPGSLRNLGGDIWWATAELPRLARRSRADLIHHPLPAHSPGAGIRQLITVTDLAYEVLPGHFDRGFRLYSHHHHRAAARAADAVICISHTTATDVRRIWGVRPDRIAVALLGPGQDLPPGAGAPAAAPTHFLYVGDNEPRKNLETLLTAYALYRAGGAAGPPLGLILAGSASARMAGVRVEPRPSAARLAGLYRGAAALIHPSLHEGFGLTPLEAMRIGTPVLAARSPGITEVCADAVRYADPRDPAGFATAMAELALDRGLRAELRERGRRRAAEFSWSGCARAHVDAYSLALHL